MSLPFDANCLPLAPFDLPYADEAAAWAALLRWTPQIVTWPTPPTEPGWQLAAAGFPGLHAGTYVEQTAFENAVEAHQLAFLRYDINHANVPAVARLTERLPWRIGDRPTMQAVLVGLYGPLSLGLTLVDADERPLFANPLMHEVLTQHLALRMGWLESQLAATCICLIEPFWDATGSPFMGYSTSEALQLVLETAALLQQSVGLAPSGAVDWPPILRSAVRLVVCQAQQREALLACGSCLNDYFDRDGVVVWAVVPSDPLQLAATSPMQLVAEWDVLLHYALARDVLNSRILSGSLLTVDTGLMQQSTATADQALALLAETSRLIRAKYKINE